MNKISAVYKIVNTITNDCYVGSSKNVKRRWIYHKHPSSWKRFSKSLMYQDMQRYGVENFRFQVLCPVMPEYLKQVEQELIEMLKPTYNDRNAKGFDAEKYYQSDKYKESSRKALKKYHNQLCLYNDETLTLNALSWRFRKAGMEHPTLEAKKYLKKDSNN